METLKAVAEVTTREAAQVAVEAIMIVDHMTEVAIVTAMIRVAVAVEVCTKGGFFSERANSFFKSPNLQKKIFQKTILNFLNKGTPATFIQFLR